MSSLLRKVGSMAGLVAILCTTMVGCAADTSDDDDDDVDPNQTEEPLAAAKSGTNGDFCRRSAYNCSLRHGDQRVSHANGSDAWKLSAASIASGTPVLDGNGVQMGLTKKSPLTLNYGQTRRMGNVTYVLALSTGLGAAGWVSADAFENPSELRNRVGEVNARGASLSKMGCYEVRTGYDPQLDHYKVVKGATDKDSEEPNDYLPYARKGAGNKIYMNLAFSAPGDALGGGAYDIFPTGTKFQRLDVPTWDSDAPSLEVKLYKKKNASAEHYDVLAARRMKFIYGYVKSKTGSLRYGWMALDGLVTSDSCPNR